MQIQRLCQFFNIVYNRPMSIDLNTIKEELEEKEYEILSRLKAEIREDEKNQEKTTIQ